MRLRMAMVLVIAPLLVLAGYFAIVDIGIQRDRSMHAHDVAANTREEGVMHDVVHELQKERGYSAGFVASSGKNFPDRLKEQRSLTDAALAVMQQDVSMILTERPSLAMEIDDKLSQLAKMRKDVDGLQVSVSQMAVYYTRTIEHMLEIARPLLDGEHSSELQSLMQASVLLAAAKERAGRERAAGASGLSGKFTPPIYDRFISLGGAQQALLLETQGVLAEPGWLKDLRKTAEFAAINKARAIIKAGQATGDFRDLTPAKWFALSTDWINVLRSREIHLTEAVNAMSSKIDTQAGKDYRWVLGLTLVVGGLAFLMAVTVFELLIRRVNGLTAVVNGFTRGDFTTFVKGIDGKDEMSLMARAIYRFKQDTLEMMRNAEKLKEDQEASQKAQDFVVEELRQGLGKLSEGDLTANFSKEFPPEYEDVRKDFNNTVLQLRDAIGEVVHASSSIHNGASEISQASDDLSQRTTSQAATLEQTAAALEELSHSVNSAAEGARKVERTTADARQEAINSGEVVQQAVTAMAAIEESSNQIARIISVIDDISFQTNLLALNAGVEAARAGEAGRGFAVVASEVRALAQRSSDAAMEIKTLIGNSSQHVDQGVKLVNQAGDALETIVQRVAHISDLVSDIAGKVHEQSIGLSEINSGVEQLDGVTQENVSMVEHATSASHMMEANAQRLQTTTNMFNLVNQSKDTIAAFDADLTQEQAALRMAG